MTKYLFSILLVGATLSACAQNDSYNAYRFGRADTLRGMLRPERTCYDVTFYELDIRVDPRKKWIGGYVDIHYKAMEDFKTLQIDMYANMEVSHILFQDKRLTFRREYDAVFVDFPQQRKGAAGTFRVQYQGTPREAPNAPWDGGFVWSKDRLGNHWIGVACEGEGASLWWPNKDHLSDEPDSMAIRIAVPAGYTCVANGNLRQTVKDGEYTRYDWFVSYPINNYNVTLNIGKYVHFSDTYTAKDGEKLALDYYVMPYNEKKAKEHFKQVHSVLACYEHYFDKYPFWRDGFALVETPYLGMEHQGAIAYGNKYMRGYLGGMIPKGMDWDYIIVHETGHEYFGNSISCNDIAEMWIHESFTTYMEALYVEHTYNYEQAVGYLVSQLPYIRNREPIIGPLDVNFDKWQGSDHYYKGAWILHTLRNTLRDNKKWFELLKGFYRKHALSNIVSRDFFNYVNTFTGRNYDAFFEQYFYNAPLPEFEYELEAKGANCRIRYKWTADVPGFNMPIMVGKKGAYEWLSPTSEWQTAVIKNVSPADFKVATEFFLVREKRVGE